MRKIEKSIGLIQLAAQTAVAPAVMLSFGKDSMVLASLIREALPGIGFPMPVIYHRDPWFPAKHDFADRIVRSWSMIVHDFLPWQTGVKTNEKAIELVARYNFGRREIDVPRNVCAPEEYPRRDFICGLNDWVKRPRAMLLNYPWDAIFIGHKSSDVDPFEGPVPLKYDMIKEGGVLVVFPLRDWTDGDVWDYIETNHVPVQATRYRDRAELSDRWYNNDYVHACTACIDPRSTAKEVFCPKLKRNVPNHRDVLQLKGVPAYMRKE